MSATKQTIEMLENLLNSQIAMGQVMDSILVVLDAPPAPMEELVEEVLTPMADAVRQAGSRLGLDFKAPESEQADGLEWDQMDAEQRQAEVKNIKKNRAIQRDQAKHQGAMEASLNSMPLQQPSEEVLQQQAALDASMDDLMGDIMNMAAQAQGPSTTLPDESDAVEE